MRAKREMLNFEITTMQPDDSGSYLEYLNKCFPGWGDQRQYDEIFRTDRGAGFADRLLAYHEGKVVGGTSVTYRLMKSKKGVIAKIGVMTGTWTFRAARGRGCYEQLLSAMQKIAVKRDCALLCGYTTKKNATYNSMLKQGLAVVGSKYLMSAESTTNSTKLDCNEYDVFAVTDELAQHHYDQIQKTGGSVNRFVCDYGVWKSLFLGGDNPKMFLVLDDESSVLAEIESGQFKVLSFAYSDNTDMQSAMTNILSASRARGKQLFMYTLDSRVATAATSNGIENMDGGFFLRHANRSAFRDWLDLDKKLMLDDENLLNPKHPSYVGDWIIQNGDRA